MSQVVQIAGALCVLAGFVLAQYRMLDPQRPPYLILNLVGSAILAVLALLDHQWGFLLLEGVWAIVSAIALVKLGNFRSDSTTSTTSTR
jgi:hypothetical protein